MLSLDNVGTEPYLLFDFAFTSIRRILNLMSCLDVPFCPIRDPRAYIEKRRNQSLEEEDQVKDDVIDML